MAVKDPSAKTKSPVSGKKSLKRAVSKPKTTAKKAAPKKPVTKKAAVKKTASKKVAAKKPAALKKTPAKKPYTKKSTAKNPAAKKAASSTAKIASVSKLAKSLPSSMAKAKAASPKTTAKKKATPKLADLQTQIKNLDTRMKRADTRTRNQVKALGETITALETASKKSSTTQKAALTRQVNQLKKKLTAISDDARQMVEAELASALARPDMDNLHNAIARSDARMAQAEAVQDAALKKVNLHLAHLARAVEAQLEQEREARTAAIAASRDELSQRLDRIEEDTASALTDVGDKIADLSGALKSKQSEGQAGLSAKVNDLAAQTEADLERYKSSIDARIDHIIAKDDSEDNAKFDRLAYQLDRLNSRLDQLEADFSELDERQSNVSQTPPSYMPEAVETPAPIAPVPMPVAVGGPSNIVPMPDAFSQAVSPSAGPSAAPTPVAPVDPQTPPREAHEPIEFVPSAFAPQTSAPQPAPNNVRDMLPTVANAETAPQATVPPAPHMPAQDIPAQPAVPPIADTAFTPASNGDALQNDMPLPYADPAYAETDMRAERVGGNPDKGGLKSRMANLPISGRNLRLAAMGVGIAAMCLYAGKNIINMSQSGNSAGQIETAQSAPQMPMAVDGSAPNGGIAQPIPIGGPTEPAIGDYADNKAPEVSATGATTLTAAADAGDPIAQFQLGLSNLENGQVEQGVSLIRLAANKNMPAAQYRLAKLYEAGEGVTADPAMARELTEKAARGGNRIAMHDLALYYTDGRGGVQTDVAKAVGWFEQAANRGVVDSQFNLAVLSESGQGIERNIETAFFWYSIAAQQGDQFAKKRVEILRDGLTAEQQQALDTRIAGFKPKAINEAANGIFRNVPWAKNDKNVQMMRVRQVQTQLTNLGYDIGGADGAIGPRTKAAIMEFQRANALPETGTVDDALIEKLELAAGA